METEQALSVDRLLDACERAEAVIEYTVGSDCIAPRARQGDRLRLRPAGIRELRQGDIVVYRQWNDQARRLAYVGVVSVLGAWVCLVNDRPDNYVTLFNYDLAELYQTISIQ